MNPSHIIISGALGTVFRLTLPMPDRKLSPNARTHWAVKARVVKAARDKGKWAAQKVLHDAGIEPPQWSKAHYFVAFFCSTAAKRDNDNLMASLKSYRDGIADSGLVADDCGMWPQGCEIKKDALNPRCEITIWEVEQ
jgi:Holliday junction resolvase RusA-like endonuclease